jgi:hypothetical protein
MLLFEQVGLSLLLVLSTQQRIVVVLLLLEQSTSAAAACWSSSLLSGWIESGIEADKLLVLRYGRCR